MYEPYILLVALIAIDYVLGTFAGVLTEGFNSSKMRMGLVHKATFFAAFGVALIVERLCFYYDLPYVYSGCITSLVFVWIAITETGSILENLVKLNPELADNAFLRIFSKKEGGEKK